MLVLWTQHNADGEKKGPAVGERKKLKPPNQTVTPLLAAHLHLCFKSFICIIIVIIIIIIIIIIIN